MSDSHFLTISNQMADAVAAIAPSTVQVQGRRRPASGIAYAPDAVLTMMRVLGREDGLRVRAPDGRTLEAELYGWDPITSLAVLRAADLKAAAASISEVPPRVGHIALAIARSWSNAVTASEGIVSVVGGPLPTRGSRGIDQVIRTTAQMHDGFTGGPLIDVAGRVMGITTGTAIRGTRVVIPAGIAWKTAATLLQHGRMKRGYIGIAGQSVQLSERQRGIASRENALLVMAVTPGGPADQAGILVGDVMTTFDDHPVGSPDDLLDVLVGERVGRQVSSRILRGDQVREIRLTAIERPRG